MKRFYRILPMATAVALCATCANAELVEVKLKATVTSADTNGVVTTLKIDQDAFTSPLICPAATNGESVVVFDTVTGDFLVLNKADGTTNCVAPLSVSGGASLPPNEDKQVRQGFLVVGGDIVGSALGKVSQSRDHDTDALTKYSWKATAQGSFAAIPEVGVGIVSAKLSTGSVFEPTGE